MDKWLGKIIEVEPGVINSDNQKQMLAVLFFYSLILVPIYNLFLAYVFMNVWIWFMVPLGLPQLGYVTTLGFFLLLSSLSLNLRFKEIEEEVLNNPKQWLSSVIRAMFYKLTFTYVCAFALSYFL